MPRSLVERQQKYSDVAIETALTLRLLFHLPLRQAEGFLQSLFGMMGIDLAVPDHTTLSRRGQLLDVSLWRVPTGGGFTLSSTARDCRSWAKASGPGRNMRTRATRGWKKLHLAVDRSGVIIEALTEGHVDDATTALHLIDAVDGDIASVTADGGLRLDRHLRCRWCAWREHGGAADQDGQGVSTETAVDLLAIARSRR